VAPARPDVALGLGFALNAPAWQAVVPELVPRAEVPAAVTLNGVSVNASRAVGPALGGALVALLDISQELHDVGHNPQVYRRETRQANGKAEGTAAARDSKALRASVTSTYAPKPSSPARSGPTRRCWFRGWSSARPRFADRLPEGAVEPGNAQAPRRRPRGKVVRSRARGPLSRTGVANLRMLWTNYPGTQDALKRQGIVVPHCAGC
jgi:hypothetical protein